MESNREKHMGTTQQIQSGSECDRTIEFLDHYFPLSEGSHSTVVSYDMYYGKLLAIHKNGKVTGLRNSSQFIEANGNHESPQSVSMESHGLKVELELARCHHGNSNHQLEHRVQLSTQFQV